LDELFAPEVAALAALAAKLGTGLDQGGIGAAIRSLLMHFPVYRSYAGDGWSADDTAHWREALTRILEFEGDEAAARAQKLFDALGEGEAARDFVTRFQQLSGPAMAKGLEDTELYRSVEFGILDRKSTRLNSSHVKISYAVFCLKKQKTTAPGVLAHVYAG